MKNVLFKIRRIYETCMMLAVMTYYWKGEPEYFEAGPQRRVGIMFVDICAISLIIV